MKKDITDIVTEITALIMKERDLSPKEAMLLFYNSATYSSLEDNKSDIWNWTIPEIYEKFKHENN